MAAAAKPTAPAEAIAPTVPEEPGLDGTLAAEVARGRSVVTDDGLQLAGATVTLPEAEARKLMALGYLVDPNAPAAAESNGPTFERRRG